LAQILEPATFLFLADILKEDFQWDNVEWVYFKTKKVAARGLLKKMDGNVRIA
jgi:hypothetical protein